MKPSLGAEIFEIIQKLQKEENLSILLVEQNAHAALSIADCGYVLENGRIILYGTEGGLNENEDVKEFYMSMNLSGEIKHYKRRGRWLG